MTDSKSHPRTPCAAGISFSVVVLRSSMKKEEACSEDTTRRFLLSQQQNVKSSGDEEHGVPDGSPITPVNREGNAAHSSSDLVAAATATTSRPNTSPFALLGVMPARFEFPFKLHQILDEAASKGMEHIISWLPDGKAFKVHCKREFETKFIPRYFISTSRPKYRSFQRQVAMYRFEMERKDPSSPYFGAYRHPLFVRGNLDLCARMARRPVKKSTRRSGKLQEQQAQEQDPLHGLLLLPKEEGRESTPSKFLPMGLDTPRQKDCLLAGGGNDGHVNTQHQYNHESTKNRDKFFASGYHAPSSSATGSPCPVTSKTMRRLSRNRETPSVLNSSSVVNSTGNEMLTSRRRPGSLLEQAQRDDEESLLQFAIQASQRLMMTAESQQQACSKSSEETSSLPTSWSRPSMLSASRTQFQSSRNRSVGIESNDDWHLFASLFGPIEDIQEMKP